MPGGRCARADRRSRATERRRVAHSLRVQGQDADQLSWKQWNPGVSLARERVRVRGRRCHEVEVLRAQLANPQVAQLDAVAVAEEGEVPLRALQAGMVLAIERLRRRGLVEIDVHDGRAVQEHPDAPAAADHLLRVPPPRGPQVPALRRGDAVDGPVRLPGLDVLVGGVAVVEDLHLHAAVRRIAAIIRGADPEAVVASRLELEVEAHGEIGVLALRVEVAAAFLPADEGAVLDGVALRRAAPAREVLAIEDRREADLGHLHVPELELAARGDLGLEADEAVGRLDPHVLPRGLAVDLERELLPPGGDHEAVPVPLPDEVPGRADVRADEAPLLAIREVDLVAVGPRLALRRELAPDVDARVPLRGLARLPLELEHEVSVALERVDETVSGLQDQRSPLERGLALV